MTGLYDSFQRPINYMRVSVTDRCNLRCTYCMPPDGIPLLDRDALLSYEEIASVVGAAADLGVSKVRITGGEPLVRLGLGGLIEMIAAGGAIDDISLTTNGVLLSQLAGELKSAGLRRVNVSLDTLRPERFHAITRGDSLKNVLDGIDRARSVGLIPVKINMVVMRGVNDDEIVDFARLTMSAAWHVRFIEVMPVNGDERARARFMSVSEIIERLDGLGNLEPCHPGIGNGPARYFRLPGAAGSIGFITPVSEHFCFHCNRLRLTADGRLRPCLMCSSEVDLRQPLRKGISREELKSLIGQAVALKPLHHHLAEGRVPSDRPFSQIGG